MKDEVKMNSTSLDSGFAAERRSRRSLRKALLTPVVCSVLASFGIFGGIASLFVGLICVLIHGLVSRDHIFDQAGTVLLIIAIPMILIGSIFLDEIQGEK